MTTSPHTTRQITHAEARAIARRLIAGSFRRDGERPAYDVGPRFSIPTRPDHDDDCLIAAYIEQREAADLVAAHEAEEAVALRKAAQAERDEWRASSAMLCDEKIALRRALDAAHDAIRSYERTVQAMREHAAAVISAGRPS